MIRLFILISLTCIATILSSQSLSSSVIGSAGALSHEPSFGTLSWSLGEPVISTFNPDPGNSPILTQGFHQVYVSGSVGSQNADDNFLLQVYPNPSNSHVIVECKEPVQIRLLTILGEYLISYEDRSTFQTMTLNEIPSGTYFLEIQRSDNTPSKFFKLLIIK